MLLILQPHGSYYYRRKQNLQNRATARGSTRHIYQVYVPYHFVPDSLSKWVNFFPETLCFPPDWSDFSFPLLPDVLQDSCIHEDPALESKTWTRRKGSGMQKQHTDCCLKSDHSRYSRCTSKETLAAIGEYIYLERWGRVAAGLVCSAKEMQGKQLAARRYTSSATLCTEPACCTSRTPNNDTQIHLHQHTVVGCWPD